VLEALGARIDLDPAAVRECIGEIGFGFMFAPRHHKATRYVVPVRKALGVRTIFNFLGPLTNPAGAGYQLVGVGDPAYVEMIAHALVELGARRAAVVAGADGMDEVSIVSETRLLEVTPDGVTSHTLTPERVGFERAEPESVRGGTPEQNAAITRAVLEGEQGPRRSLVVMNAGAALFVNGRAPGFEEGVRLAEEAIDSGAALDTLERFIRRTRELTA
jgi:anthranilate phosphoribosyltransferase